MDKLEMWVKEFTQLAVDADDDQADYFTAGANDMLALIAERDQLRADKLEMAADAKRWAEEAGRLKALLHDAKPHGFVLVPRIVTPEIEAVYANDAGAYQSAQELHDAMIDAARAAEREGQG